MPIRFLINIVVVVNFYNFYLNYKYSVLFSFRYYRRSRGRSKLLLNSENNVERMSRPSPFQGEPLSTTNER